MTSLKIKQAIVYREQNDTIVVHATLNHIYLAPRNSLLDRNPHWQTVNIDDDHIRLAFVNF